MFKTGSSTNFYTREDSARSELETRIKNAIGDLNEKYNKNRGIVRSGIHIISNLISAIKSKLKLEHPMIILSTIYINLEIVKDKTEYIYKEFTSRVWKDDDKSSKYSNVFVPFHESFNEFIPTNTDSQLNTFKKYAYNFVSESQFNTLELEFAKYIDSIECVEWWVKQKNRSKIAFAFEYIKDQISELMYPDFIIKTKNNLYILDTKSEWSNDPDKATALANLETKIVNDKNLIQISGCVVEENKKWYILDEKNIKTELKIE
jgi:hypothetical protein